MARLSADYEIQHGEKGGHETLNEGRARFINDLVLGNIRKASEHPDPRVLETGALQLLLTPLAYIERREESAGLYARGMQVLGSLVFRLKMLLQKASAWLLLDSRQMLSS